MSLLVNIIVYYCTDNVCNGQTNSVPVTSITRERLATRSVEPATITVETQTHSGGSTITSTICTQCHWSHSLWCYDKEHSFSNI